MNLNQKYLKIVLLMVALAIGMGAYAEQRTVEQAFEAARQFNTTKLNKKASSLIQVDVNKVKKNATAQPGSQISGSAFYIFNNPTENGFVIVSGDTRMQEILGYSDCGTFSTDSMSSSVQSLLENYQKAYNTVQLLPEKPQQASNEVRKVPAVAPLIQTHWNQRAPYYNYCPKYMDILTCVTGCVATSMSQVMNYHKHPARGKGRVSYTSPWGSNLSLDLSTCVFDWTDMALEYNNESTADQQDAVATLMKAAGYSVYMQYTFLESGAYACDIPYALIHNFDYNPNIIYAHSRYYSKEDWLAALDNELDNNRPVIYGAQGFDSEGNTGGHSFIIDGRDSEGYYHVNFGWSGSDDGYYTINAMIGGGYTFSENHDMIIGVAKETIGKKQNVFYAEKFEMRQSYGKVKFDLKSYCYSSDAQYSDGKNGNNAKCYARICVGLFDKDFQLVKNLYKTSYTSFGIGEGYGLSDKILDLTPTEYKEGEQFYIAPYSEDLYDDLTLTRTINGAEDWYLVTILSDGKLEIKVKGKIEDDPQPEPDPAPAPELKQGYYNASANLTGKGPKNWQIQIIKDDSDNSKYWVANIDAVVSEKGYSYEKGWNKVYGILNEFGTRLSIPSNQCIGENIYLKSFADNDEIVLNIGDDQLSMWTDNAWGSVSVAGTGDTSAEIISKYTDLQMSYTEDVFNISKPVISFKDGKVTIYSATESAEIHYTLNRQNPSVNSPIYTGSFAVSENCTIKAIAVGNGKISEVATHEITSFTVSSPVITASGNNITITSDAGATIYYTIEGSIPSKQSNNEYKGAFTLDHTAVIKAIATKNNFNDSPVASYNHIIAPIDALVLNNPSAGSLSSSTNHSDALNAKSILINGDLNGDDVKFMKEILDNGKLSDLDLTNARIVKGGGNYKESSYVDYKTEDNVIGSYFFEEYSSLLSLKLPTSIRTIDMNGLSNLKNLVELIIPEGCNKIDFMGLNRLSSLEQLTLPASLTDFDGGSINECEALAQIHVSPDSRNFKESEGVLFDYGMTKLVKYPINHGLSYTIPAGVTTIGDYSFTSSLVSEVIIPEGVTVIENSAFNYCSGITEINLPESVSTLKMFAFGHCGLSEVKLPGVETVESFAFAYNRNLSSVEFGPKAKKIDGYAFSGCSLIKRYVVDENNPNLSGVDGILFNYDQTKLLRFPVAKIVTNYTVPSTVLEIGDNAFDDCVNIKENIFISDQVTEIGSNAFSYCGCKSIIFGPESRIAKIGMLAFSHCDNLKNLVMPSLVSEIPSFAGAYCKSLEMLQISGNVSSIDSYAFSSSKNLSTIRSEISNISAVNVSNTAFDDIDALCTWYVPVGTAAAYKSRPWWVGTWQIEEVSGVKDVHSESASLDIEASGNGVTIKSHSDCKLPVYDIDGRMVTILDIKSGTNNYRLAPGKIYVIANQKFIVK